MQNTMIVSGARTPIGKLLGSLSHLTAVELGAHAIQATIERSGISISEQTIDHVYMGQVLTAGAGQIPARQAASKAGVSMSTPATNINKVCLSGLSAIGHGDMSIRAGATEVVIAGGMESMSQAPHLLPNSRTGTKYGDTKLVDSMAIDGLWCAFDDCSMGEGTERYLRSRVSRQRQDEWSARSHQLSRDNQTKLAEEIAPVRNAKQSSNHSGLKAEETDDGLIKHDEGVRIDSSLENLAKLRPAFVGDGTITAGNSSQISDGACALLLASSDSSKTSDLSCLAKIEAYAQVAGPDPSLLQQPSSAIRKACSIAGIAVSEIDLFEINEAFAAVVLASIDDLGIDENKVNVNGGAIALGHPIGMSGTRVVLTLAYELRRRGGGVGVAALCGGGGQGDAIVIRV